MRREPRIETSRRLCNSSKERCVPRTLSVDGESPGSLSRARVPSVASHDPTCASPIIDAEDRHPMGRPSRCRFQARCSCLQDLRGGEATSTASAHSLDARLAAAGREAVPVPQSESTERCNWRSAAGSAITWIWAILPPVIVNWVT